MSRRGGKRQQKKVQRRGINLLGTNIQPGNMLVISDAMLQTMFSQQAPQKKATTVLTPGVPLQPYEGITPKQGPRQYSYPIGTNLTTNDRAYGNRDIPSFQQLRSLASLYDGIGLCDRVWLDYVAKTKLKVSLHPQIAEEGASEKDYQKEISAILTFFEKPDRIHDLHSWLRIALTEQLHLDALPVYFHPTRAGGLYALEIVAGDTIKPLLDERGMQPQPPWPAYQQYLYGGIPGGLFTSEQMAYIVESPRADSVFGLSRVERIIMRVNQAIRKQAKDLARFTDGNIPAGFLGLPAGGDQVWTTDDITSYQTYFDKLLAGNDAMRSRIKVMPPGATYTATDDASILTDFDRYLLNCAVAAYGVTLEDLGFTETSNRSTGQAQENVTYRRAMSVLFAMYAGLLTYVIRTWFRNPYLVASFGGFEEPEDLLSLSQAYGNFIDHAVISPSDVAEKMKFPVPVKVPPFYPTKDALVPLDQIVNMAAMQMQQMQQQINQPQPDEDEGNSSQGQDDNTDEPGSNDDEQQQKSPTSATPARPQQKTPSTQSASANAKSQDVQEQQEEREDGEEDTERVSRAGDSLRPEVVQHHTGMMIAFMLDPDTAEQLALPGGEPVQDLHVTLAYLGDMQDVTIDGDMLKRELASFASEAMPLEGATGGLGRFTPSASSDDLSPVIALVNVPGLQQWRADLVQRLEGIGVEVAKDFDFTPHITLAYIPSDADMPVETIPALPLVFDTLCLAVGDDHSFFRLGEEQYLQYWEAKETKEAHQPGTEAAIRAEYRRWRDWATKEVRKNGRVTRRFETTLIPQHDWKRLCGSLAGCQTIEEVRAAFEMHRQASEHVEASTSRNVLVKQIKQIFAQVEERGRQQSKEVLSHEQ